MPKLKYNDGTGFKQIAPSMEEFEIEKNKLSSHEADITNFKNATNTSIENIEKEIANYNSYATLKDDNGIFTTVEYKRADGTLYMKSSLSNEDVDGNYQTNTWELYDELGTSVIDTIVWSIEYDEDGDVISKVVS